MRTLNAMAKARPTRSRPLTLRFLSAPDRAHKKSLISPKRHQGRFVIAVPPRLPTVLLRATSLARNLRNRAIRAISRSGSDQILQGFQPRPYSLVDDPLLLPSSIATLNHNVRFGASKFQKIVLPARSFHTGLS